MISHRRITPRTRSDQRNQSGFTLIEVLVATAVTLLMMIALARSFKIIGDSMQQGRAKLELNNRLRNVVLRIQNDLSNLALDKEVGYLEYNDGGQTDGTASLARPGNAPVVGASRYGDTDDTLMFTSKAEEVWFTGKVPLFVLRGALIPSDPSDPAYRENFEMVTVASEYAEIAVFAQPLVSNVGNVSYDPAPLVADPSAYLDANVHTHANGTVTTGDSFPDDFRLHYKVLLIRPDLNVNIAAAPAVGSVLPSTLATGSDFQGEPWLRAAPGFGVLPGGSASFSLPTPACDMARAHAQCDLSMRRVRATPAQDGLPAAADYLAANSLQDLKDPANRFAHVELPVAGGRSLPFIALTAQVGGAFFDFNGDGSNDLSEPSAAVGVGTGYIHPAFTRHTAFDAADPSAGLPSHQITAGRVGEDILANDIRAFDVQGYDPGVPVIASSGAILLPSDPGYAMASYRLADAPNVDATLVSYGGYVDLGWARKVLTTFPAYGLTFRTGGSFPSTPNYWSALSGYDARFWTSTVSPPFTDELYRSGKVLASPDTGTPLIAMQFTADTSSYDHLESNAVQEVQTSGRLGTIHRDLASGAALFSSAFSRRLDDTWRGALVDAGTDGLFNGRPLPPGEAAFADDLVERESSTPFIQELSGVQISIRMEDHATRTVDQMKISQALPSVR
ncbi:MAG: prepilin-type N-terminal cleavage/methylation domain-containing protein [Planctomycetota bacterium]|nr:prepilin-type N-terminal cleavage/methylation domain-containing protein [Planctomycetota bacterium]